MVRLVSGPAVLAVLGLAGLAMAQDDLIVDPWQRVVAAVVGPRSTPAPAVPAARPVGVASFPIDDPKPKPTVVPVGPPLARAPSRVTPLGPVTPDGIVDPWAGAPPAARVNGRTATRSNQRDWAFEIDEIVDPWSKGPLVAFTDPLIVDPWAR